MGFGGVETSRWLWPSMEKLEVLITSKLENKRKVRAEKRKNIEITI